MVHLRHADKTYSKKLSLACDSSSLFFRGVLVEFDGKNGYSG